MARKAAGIYKRKDGTYCNRFTVNGKRYAVYGKSVPECRAKEAERRQQIAEGMLKSGKNQKLSEYAETWIDNKHGTVKETTIYTEKRLFSVISKVVLDDVGTVFGDLTLGTVEPQNIRDVQRILSNTLTTNSTNQCISLLSSMFNAAIRDRLITFNPTAGVKPLKRTEEQARNTIHRALTKKETTIFLEIAKNGMEEKNISKSWYYNLYVFLLHTGCRIGEAGAVMAKDISNGVLTVSRTVTRDESGTRILGEETKTAAGRRTIPLTAEALKAIADQRELESMFGNGIIAFNKPIFRTQNGSLLETPGINSNIARICEAVGIERFTCHAFRDTFATRCVESGMQAKTLQEILGHTDINMTMALYAHAMEDTKVEQINAVKFG